MPNDSSVEDAPHKKLTLAARKALVQEYTMRYDDERLYTLTLGGRDMNYLAECLLFGIEYEEDADVAEPQVRLLEKLMMAHKIE